MTQVCHSCHEVWDFCYVLQEKNKDSARAGLIDLLLKVCPCAVNLDVSAECGDVPALVASLAGVEVGRRERCAVSHGCGLKHLSNGFWYVTVYPLS